MEFHEERKKAAPPTPEATTLSTPKESEKIQQASWTIILGILAAVVAFTWVLLSMSI